MSTGVPFSEFVSAQREALPTIPQSCAGQTIIVTGANTGLGFEAAKHYVRLGASRVVLAVRSARKGDAARAAIEQATGVHGVARVWPLDLASNASIRAFAQRAEAELAGGEGGRRIDAVLANAGVGMDAWTVAADGATETTVQVNVVGTFLLALLLLPLLRQSALRNAGTAPHLTVVASSLHAVAAFEEGREEDVFEALNRADGTYDITDRYNVSKLLEVYGVRALCERLPYAPASSSSSAPNGNRGRSSGGVVINLLNPGLCHTDLCNNMGWRRWAFATAFKFFLARSAEEGAKTLLHAACAGPKSHGKYLSDCKIKEHWVAPFVVTEEGHRMQEKVWEQLARKMESIEPGCVGRATEG